MASAAPVPQRVCVTGATSFVGSHIIVVLLKRGHTVVGTVRSIADTKKYLFLQRLAAELGAGSRLTLVEADNLIPGSYNRAVQGCSSVIHTASPFIMGQERLRSLFLLCPAVQAR
jgi:nucleoside-diphosphate-sugar epimerase